MVTAPPSAGPPASSTARAGGRQVCLLPPWPSSTPFYCGWLGGDLVSGEMEGRFGPCHGAPITHPQPPPGSGWGRNSWASAPTLHTKHTKRRIVTTISINKVGQIQPWQKWESSRWLRERGAWATPRLDLGLKSARTARSTRSSLQQTASLHKHQRLANPLRQCTARKRFWKAWALLKRRLKKRLVHPNLHRLAKGRELLWAAPGQQPGGKSYTCVSIQKLQNQTVTLYYIYCP